MNSAEEYKSGVGGSNKLGQSLFKNRLAEKHLEKKLDEIDKLWLRRERKLESKKYEFDFSRRRSRRESKVSTANTTASNRSKDGCTNANSNNSNTNSSPNSDNKSQDNTNSSNNTANSDKEKDREKEKEKEATNINDILFSPNSDATNSFTYSSRGSYKAMFQKHRLDSTLRKLNLKPIKVNCAPLETTNSHSSFKSCVMSSSSANTTNSLSNLENALTSSEIQFTSKVCSTRTRNCLNISKVECVPKKTYEESSISFINTIRIAKSIYEFKAMEHQQQHQQQQEKPGCNKQPPSSPPQQPPQTEPSTDTDTNKDNRDQQEASTTDFNNNGSSNTNASPATNTNHNQSRLKNNVSQLRRASVCNTSDMLKSNSMHDFNTLKPINDQRFVDLIALLKLEN